MNHDINLKKYKLKLINTIFILSIGLFTLSIITLSYLFFSKSFTDIINTKYLTVLSPLVFSTIFLAIAISVKLLAKNKKLLEMFEICSNVKYKCSLLFLKLFKDSIRNYRKNYSIVFVYFIIVLSKNILLYLLNYHKFNFIIISLVELFVLIISFSLLSAILSYLDHSDIIISQEKIKIRRRVGRKTNIRLKNIETVNEKFFSLKIETKSGEKYYIPKIENAETIIENNVVLSSLVED
jgi:hypothetical protein